MKDYQQTYNEFWKEIVEKNGSLDLDQVKRELHDYHHLIENCSKVYMNVSGGRISKPNTSAEAVIGEAENTSNRFLAQVISEAFPDIGPVQGFDWDQFHETHNCIKCFSAMKLKDGHEWPDDPRLLVCTSCAIEILEELLAKVDFKP